MKKKRTPRIAPLRRDAVETRARLLSEAGHAFAEHGYDGVGLRDICKAAEVNLGAVKYYFGSKQELYREALIQPHIQLLQEESVPSFDGSTDPEGALLNWLYFALRTVLVRRREHPYLSRLFIREFANPSFALEKLIELVLKKVRHELVRIVMALKHKDQEDSQVAELANMVILLCVQQEVGRPVLERLAYPPPTKDQDVRALAERIHRFVLAGIKASV